MKKGIFYAFLFLSTIINSFGQNYFLGTDCGGGSGYTYTNYDMNDLGAFHQIRILENHSTSAGSRKWEFNADGYFNTWRAPSGTAINIAGHNQIIAPNSATASAFWRNNFGGGDGARLLATTSGRYYTFNLQENGYNNLRMAVLETSYNPVTTSGISTSVGTFNSRNISITTSSTPNGSEYIYVRYSTDAFATSTIVQATGSGTSWNANIPCVSGTVTYYIYTSNQTKSTIDAAVTTNGQLAHDMFTLTINNNNGSNYSYVTSTSGITYYSVTSATNPNSLANWTTNPNGTGCNPTNFSGATDVFVVQNGTTMTTTAAWAVGGTGTSRLQIESGASLTASHTITFTSTHTFQIDNGGTFIQNTVMSVLGSTVIDNNGTFNLQGSGDINFPVATVSNMNNLTVNRTAGIVTLDKSLTVSGTLTLTNGALAIGSNTLTLNGGAISVGSGSLTTTSSSNLSFGGTNAGPLNIPSSVTALNNLSINNTNGTPARIDLNSSPTISGALSLTSGTLALGSNTLTLAGTVSRTSGFLRGSNSSNLVVQGSTAKTLHFDQGTDGSHLNPTTGTNSLGDLTLNTSGNLVLGNKVNLYGALTTATGTTLNTGDGLLVFRNTSSSTSRLAAVTGTPTITGAVVVENYINNQNRGWRLLTSPLTSAGSGGTVTPSVQSNWQSVMGYGGNYGTNFYSPSGLNGMDGTSNRNSLLRFNGDTLTVGGWTNINSTGVNQFNADAQSGTSSTNPVFFAFIRGDKTVTAVPNAGTPNAFVATTLAAKGRITYGSKTISLLGKTNGYTAIGNPFISPVDLSVAAATATGLTGTYYYYNPSNAAWVAVSSSNGWTSGSFTQNMQTGVSVLAQFNGGNSGSIQFTEASKVSTLSTVQTGAGNGLQDNMRINLFDVNSTSGAKTQLDELFVGFKTGYNAGFINTEDGEKMLNAGENLSSRVGNKLVAIDVRPYIQNSDSIFMNFTNTRVANYEFEFDPSNFDATVTSAKLVDKFLNNETPISLSAKTTVPFSVTATAGSNAADRFMVVFNGTGALPNRGFSVTGEKLGTNKVKINWEAVNEFGVKHYELEHSTDGRTFSKINTQVGKNGNVTNSYTYTDNNPTNGVNYYRIKTTQNNDIERYSTTITINLSFNTQQSSMVVYPNPVKGNVIGLQLQDMEKGVYSVRLLSIEGKEVYKQQLQVSGNSLSTTISPSTRLAQGAYTLQVVGKNNSYTQKVVVE